MPFGAAAPMRLRRNAGVRGTGSFHLLAIARSYNRQQLRAGVVQGSDLGKRPASACRHGSTRSNAGQTPVKRRSNTPIKHPELRA